MKREELHSQLQQFVDASIGMDDVRHFALVCAAQLLLKALGIDFENDDSTRDTPKRFADAWLEICRGYTLDKQEILSTTFVVPSQQMIVLRQIPYYSVCEHHLLPFYGHVSIGYIPDKNRVLGMSKLARLVDMFSQRLQVQERMTEQIAEALVDAPLSPKGVGVVCHGTHLCSCMRGIRKEADFVTSALRGVFLSEPGVREEFFKLAEWK